MPVSENANHLKYPRKSYTEHSNNNRYASIDTHRVLPYSLACLSRSSSNSYVELTDDESTPLLNGNSKLPKKVSSKRRGILLSIFVLFYAGFLILGSYTFRTFELSEELKERQSYRDVRQGFLLKYPSVLGRIYSFSFGLNLSLLNLMFPDFTEHFFLICLQMMTWKSLSRALLKSIARVYQCYVMPLVI